MHRFSFFKTFLLTAMSPFSFLLLFSFLFSFIFQIDLPKVKPLYCWFKHRVSSWIYLLISLHFYFLIHLFLPFPWKSENKGSAILRRHINPQHREVPINRVTVQPSLCEIEKFPRMWGLGAKTRVWFTQVLRWVWPSCPKLMGPSLVDEMADTEATVASGIT